MLFGLESILKASVRIIFHVEFKINKCLTASLNTLLSFEATYVKLRIVTSMA